MAKAQPETYDDRTDSTFVACWPEKNPASIALSGGGRADLSEADAYAESMFGDFERLEMWEVHAHAVRVGSWESEQ